MAVDYKRAGVDVAKAGKLVKVIAGLSAGKSVPGVGRRSGVRSAIGGYASLFEISRDTWLAASTDGVGTKLKLAFETGIHDTVGVDLVAMSANDLLCVGARPQFFLDYFATGGLDLQVAKTVIRGIARGCAEAECALVGGETAEMPGFYSPGEYDLAGFCVGAVRPRDVIPRRNIRPGDLLIGIRSSGAHSNGYSLIRRLLKNESGARRKARLKELLTPTRIYVRSLAPLLSRGWVKGAAHITGAGYLNVPRMGTHVGYEIHLPDAAQLPKVFGWIRERAGLSFSELARTFNLGLGMILVVERRNAGLVLQSLRRSGERAWVVGEAIRNPKPREGLVVLTDSGGSETVILRGSKTAT
jgi:phosphoribosylaminoimidazole synthetase